MLVMTMTLAYLKLASIEASFKYIGEHSNILAVTGLETYWHSV